MEFDQALKIILKLEGGEKITDDPKDPGGLTKFGISKRSYPTLDIRNLSLEDASDIYLVDYWISSGCDKLPNHLRLMTFDCAVNQGTGFAKACLEKIAQQYPLSDAGQISAFYGLRKARYEKNSQFKRFGKGWMNRLDLIDKLSVEELKKDLGAE